MALILLWTEQARHEFNLYFLMSIFYHNCLKNKLTNKKKKVSLQLHPFTLFLFDFEFGSAKEIFFNNTRIFATNTGKGQPKTKR